MKSPIVMWILIAVGVILLYSAYKGKSPKDVLANVTTAVKP